MNEIKQVNSDHIYEILQIWNLSNERTNEIYQSKDNATYEIGDRYILKYNPNTVQVEENLKLIKLLSEADIPMVKVVPTSTGSMVSACNRYVLMERSKGVHLDSQTASGSEIQAFGRELARLHQVLKAKESELDYRNENFLQTWKHYIKPGLENVDEVLVQEVEEKLVRNFEKLPQQPIHRDVHFHNVLFDQGSLTAWLDFDLTEKNARIFDLAYFLAGELVDAIKEEDSLRRWQQLYKNFLVGYHEVNPLSNEEVEALPILMIGIELLFVTYWHHEKNEIERGKALALAEWLYTQYFKI